MSEKPAPTSRSVQRMPPECSPSPRNAILLTQVAVYTLKAAVKAEVGEGQVLRVERSLASWCKLMELQAGRNAALNEKPKDVVKVKKRDDLQNRI